MSLSLGAIRSLKQGAEPRGCIVTTDLGKVSPSFHLNDSDTSPILFLASAMPLLEQNIASNKAVFRAASVKPEAVVLDWDEDTLPAEVTAFGTGFDVIV